jgi:hypothetical protein
LGVAASPTPAAAAGAVGPAGAGAGRFRASTTARCRSVSRYRSAADSTGASAPQRGALSRRAAPSTVADSVEGNRTKSELGYGRDGPTGTYLPGKALLCGKCLLPSSFDRSWPRCAGLWPCNWTAQHLHSSATSSLIPLFSRRVSRKGRMYGLRLSKSPVRDSVLCLCRRSHIPLLNPRTAEALTGMAPFSSGDGPE